MILVVCLVVMSGCFPRSVPLTILPMEKPETAALHWKGIEQYHVGEWEAALEWFSSALRVNSLLVEAEFTVALALHLIRSASRSQATFSIGWKARS